MARKATDQVTTIGIDIGKNSFHLIGLDDAGNIVLHHKLSRSQVIVRLANLQGVMSPSGHNRKSAKVVGMSTFGGTAEVDFGRLEVSL